MRASEWGRLLWKDLSPTAGAPLLPLNVTRFPQAGWLPHGLVGLAAVVFAGFSWHTLLMDYGIANTTAASLGIVHAMALPLCLLWPMSGWWLSLTMVVVTAVAAASVRDGGEGPLVAGPSLAVHLSVLALVGLRVRPRVLGEMWALTLAAGCVLALAFPGTEGFPGLVESAMLSGTVLIAAGALRGRGEALRRLAQQERFTAEARAREALLEERTRIARELHDVVAHHMSVVAIQAEAAPYRVAEPPEELARSFAAIRGNALEALDELHRILGLLRSGTGEAGAAPQPTLDVLGELLAGVREAGPDVSLNVSGTRRQLPPGVELSAYRIVQESLSNVLRHAPGAAVQVAVAYRLDRLEVRVDNGPSPGPRPAPGDHSGHGLLGMRERAAMLGGELVTGPRPDGGYTVAATLPLPRGEAP